VSSALGLLVGVVLGVWATWSLQQQTHVLLRRKAVTLSPLAGSDLLPKAVTVSPLLWSSLLRVATVGVVLTVLLAWSPVVMLVAVIGYWLGRSTYLVKCHAFL
jgi:hypothetical protein